MKGLALEYPVLIFIVIVVVIVAIGIIKHFSEQVDFSDGMDFPPNPQYLCAQLNNTEINFEDFQDVLYGFLKGKCNDFFGTTNEGININDIKSIVKIIDKSVKVVQTSECTMPNVNTHTVYVNFTGIEREGNIYLKRKEIDNSDVLICGV